jgi:hypothetical protein
MAVISMLVLFLIIASYPLTAGVKAQNEVTWVYDYPTGMKTAAAQNRPAMIYIHEQWCPRCRNMDQTVFNNSEVIALSAKFVNVNVLGTEQGTLYNYRRPPMVVFTDPYGKVVDKRNIELSASEVTALQEKVVAQEPFAIPSPTVNPSTTQVFTTHTTTMNTTTSAKAAPIMPGFEAICSILSVSAAAVLLSRVRRRAR